MDVTQLALTWAGWPNGENLLWLACKFHLDQSERCHRKSTQVHTRPCCKYTRRKFSTCVYLRLRLAGALQTQRKFQLFLIFQFILASYRHSIFIYFNWFLFYWYTNKLTGELLWRTTIATRIFTLNQYCILYIVLYCNNWMKKKSLKVTLFF